MPSLAPLIVIPARMASTRLPGKPLAMIGGAPMIVQVWRRAMEAEIGPALVACAEREIFDVIVNAGGQAVLTDPDAPSGSDRAWRGAERFDPHAKHDVIVNVQGDLPTVDPAAIRAALGPLADPATDISTLVAELVDPGEKTNPNVVKAITGLSNDPASPSAARALYFTRAAAPANDGPLWRHIGVYAYRRGALKRFASLPPSPLEIRERLEQLRALEAGMRIDCARIDTAPLGVDSPADLDRARAILGHGRPL